MAATILHSPAVCLVRVRLISACNRQNGSANLCLSEAVNPPLFSTTGK